MRLSGAFKNYIEGYLISREIEDTLDDHQLLKLQADVTAFLDKQLIYTCHHCGRNHLDTSIEKHLGGNCLKK